mgnify:CR=1 FL=1
MNLVKLTGKTKVAGVFGDPVEHSLSPLMHNAAYASLGMDWVYVPFHVKAEALAAAVQGVRALGIAGVNVTVPHKVAVMEHLDEIDEEARLIGAVNTVVHREGRLLGYNTDGRGFLRSLERETGRTPRGASVMIVGAGGAALAIAASLALAGARRLWVVNRTLEKAQAVAKRVAARVLARALPLDESDPAFRRALREAEIIIHTTSVGMYPHHDVPPVVPVEAIDPAALVCDIVYRPRQTALIRAARERGCAVLTGEGMLAFQGAIAFELITGHRAPEALMLDTLRRHLAETECESR